MAVNKLPDGRWRVDVEPVKGRRFRKLFATKGEALRYEAHIKSELLNPAWQKPKQDNRRLADLVFDWYNLHGCHLRDGSRRLAKLSHLVKSLGNPVAGTLTASAFAAYRVKRQALGISGKTLNNELGYLRAVFNELRGLGVIHYDNPLASVKSLKLQQRALSFLTPDQISELLTVIKSGSENVHLLPLTLLCLGTGCRWSEAENLKAKNLHADHVVFEGTKSGKVRAVPVSAPLVKLIRQHWKLCGPFTGSLSSFRRALKRCSFTLPPGQASHVLRHTFASHFVQNGGSILVLQKILGHSSVQVTMRYAHLAPDHLQDALTINPLNSFDTFSTLQVKNRKSPENV